MTASERPVSANAAKFQRVRRAYPNALDAESAYARTKRGLDIVLAGIALLVSVPLLLAAAAAIRLTSSGPAIFRQVRVGKNEVPFTLLKLRTMRFACDDRDHRELNTREILGIEVPPTDGEKQDHKLDRRDPRITPIGRILRQFSIDELPQLINVLKGDMSLVGPRPSLPWEVDLYSPEQRRRHKVRPGLTGLWQVSGRERLTMPEMLAQDLVYVNTRCMRLDLRILVRTPIAVLTSAIRARAAGS